MMLRPKTKVAVLECEHSLDPDGTLYGGYGGLIASWLRENVDIKSNTEIIVLDAVNSSQYLDEEFDVMVISGSQTSVEDPAPWVKQLHSFVKDQLTMGSAKMVGLCFGHQMIGKALGSSSERVDRHFELSLTEIKLSSEGQKLFNQPTLSLNQLHFETVTQCPHGVSLLGSTARCRLQGFYDPDRLLSFQAHPEFDRTVTGKLLELMHDRGAINDGDFEDAMVRNRGIADRAVVLRAIAKFIFPSQCYIT